MIIHIANATDVELNDRDNFKAFKVTLGSPDLTPAEIAAALSGIATVERDGRTVWVSGDALKTWRGQPQPAEWTASFDKMVASVKKFGWVNEADGTVRAHIEGAT
jgi:hypothetical protein